MLNKIIVSYKESYGGLSRAVWLLALVMFINRSGTMVVPFLTIYLSSQLGFSLTEAGIVLSFFGAGGFAGSYIAGWLTDRYGFFWIQVGSLIGSGLLFFVLLQMDSFWGFSICSFCISAIADSYRPANQVAIASYAKEGNLTKAVSLVRMAANLGFGTGPALGGFLSSIGFEWLFIADGVTCIMAGVALYFFFVHRRPLRSVDRKKQAFFNPVLFGDTTFLVFTFLVAMFATVFFQFFSTLPLFYQKEHHLDGLTVGLLLGLNGIIVFLIEMHVINYLRPKSLLGLAGMGTVLTGISYLILNIPGGMPILIVNIVVITLSEVISMPYMATYAIQRAPKGNEGVYSGFFYMAYTVAHIIAPFIGTTLAEHVGFANLWYIIGAMGVLVGIVLSRLK